MYVNKMYLEISMQVIWKSICHLIWVWITKIVPIRNFDIHACIYKMYLEFLMQVIWREFVIDLNITKVHWARCRKEKRYF